MHQFRKSERVALTPMNIILALSPRGDFRFMVVGGSIKKVFVEFLKRLLVGSEKRVFLIVYGHPTHQSKLAKEFAFFTKGKMELFYLPHIHQNTIQTGGYGIN